MEEEEAAAPWRVCLGGLRCLAGAMPWDRNCRSQCATKSMKWSSVGVRRRPGRLRCQIPKRWGGRHWRAYSTLMGRSSYPIIATGGSRSCWFTDLAARWAARKSRSRCQRSTKEISGPWPGSIRPSPMPQGGSLGYALLIRWITAWWLTASALTRLTLLGTKRMGGGGCASVVGGVV